MNFARYLKLAPAGALLLSLTGCGVPSIPRPPSLNLPQPVSDLRSVRKGDKVYLAWTVPTETTDGLRVRQPGVTHICRNTEPSASDCSTPVANVPPPTQGSQKNAAPQNLNRQATYTDQLPPAILSDHPAAELFYAVSVLNQRGRSAGLSNKVAIPAVAALPPPSDFRVQVTADGVLSSWTGNSQSAETPGLHHFYRVYRREVGMTTDTIAGEMPFATLRTYLMLDHDFEWEKTYEYRVTVVDVMDIPGRTETQFEGDDTAPVRVFAHDIFPPAVPSGLQAVFSGVGQQPFIDLIWAPDTDPDLAGYNVYRRESGEPEQKINSEIVKTPAYRDTNVHEGHTYFYSISAVDVRGNESAHTVETSESVP